MKKIMFCLLLAVAGMMVAGCSSCQSENKKQEVVTDSYDGVSPEVTVSVEHIISQHREIMFKLVEGDEYTWYTTSVVYADFLDSENQDGKVLDITSVFQTFSEEEGPTVQMITTNTIKGTKVLEPAHDIWIEDCSLNEAALKLTFADAYKKLMETNIVKPHTKACYLRMPMGPKVCNAQYVFGTIAEPIFVDAVTGNVTTSNPAF